MVARGMRSLTPRVNCLQSCPIDWLVAILAWIIAGEYPLPHGDYESTEGVFLGMPFVPGISLLASKDDWVVVGHFRVADRPLNDALVFIHEDRITVDCFKRIE